MLARQRQRYGLAIDFEAADTRGIFVRRPRETGIQLLAHDAADLGDRRQRVHGDVDRRMGLFERADPTPQQAGIGHRGHETELKTAQFAASGLPGDCRRLFGFAQRGARAFQKALACVGDDGSPVAFALEELRAQVAFEFLI